MKRAFKEFLDFKKISAQLSQIIFDFLVVVFATNLEVFYVCEHAKL